MDRKCKIAQRCLLAVSGLLLLGSCAGPAAEEDDALESAVSSRSASWAPLGGNLSPSSAALVTMVSLAGDPRLQPVLAFSYIDSAQADKTQVARWSGGDWVALGQPFAALGPSDASDSQRHPYVCVGGGGPFVHRWSGASWAALGGNISEETGYKGSRYQVDSCGGLVLDSTETPIVAWSADVGAKANLVYAARWNRQLQKWEGLGAGSIGGRATSAVLDIDARDRLYVAAYSPGGSYGGGATTRVWRFQGGTWTQLGQDMPGTDSPVIAVYENTAYLALSSHASTALRVLRWQEDSWLDLPSPGGGTLPALDFTPSGKLVLAYVDDGTPARLRVKYLSGGTWHSVGASVSDAAGESIGDLDLSLDARGRPCLAWHEQDASGNTSVLVRRYGAALP